MYVVGKIRKLPPARDGVRNNTRRWPFQAISGVGLFSKNPNPLSAAEHLAETIRLPTSVHSRGSSTCANRPRGLRTRYLSPLPTLASQAIEERATVQKRFRAPVLTMAISGRM
jgi:hypothetical protein